MLGSMGALSDAFDVVLSRGRVRILLLTVAVSCGSHVAHREVSSAPGHAAPPPQPPSAEDAGAPGPRLRIVQISERVDPLEERAIAWSHGEVVGCTEHHVWCRNDCLVVDKGGKLFREEGSVLTPLVLPGIVNPLVSMSADCTKAAFLVSKTASIYEVWDVTTKRRLHRSHALAGTWLPELSQSGRFLQWRGVSWNATADRYEAIPSGVVGPPLGLDSVMSPDDRFVFVGGGDDPGLVAVPDWSRVYSVPPAEWLGDGRANVDGHLCGNLLVTVSAASDGDKLAIRTTNDPTILATIQPAESFRLAFSPDGSRFATFGPPAVRTYELQRCEGERCAPLRGCVF